MLTSTLTRPVTLNPTMNCDRKIYLLETVDIGPLRRPKPRTITLEAIPKRPRNRTPSKAALTQVSQSSANIEVNLASRPPCSESHSVRSSEEVCQSPAPSDISTTGAESSSNASFRIRSGPSAPPSSLAHDPLVSGTPKQDKTITAAIELLQGGCLPGDTISVKISVDHTKPIVSTNGIIVTLYRQGRVDMHPALPLGPPEPGKKPHYEDYYPKSRTGLGGLSLSSAASTQGFRMDLDQSFTPLIIDPNTLTAVVKASVRIPENVFPTISNTPGSMISFCYFVEVIIDLRGKLTLPDRILPRLGMKGSPKIHGYMDTMTWRSVGLPDPYRSQGTNFADTDQIRREKSVVACSFEVIVGTKDSTRRGSKRTEEVLEQVNMGQQQMPSGEVGIQGENGGAYDGSNETPRANRRDQNFNRGFNQGYDQDRQDETSDDHLRQEEVVLPHIPLPSNSPEPRDEKARIRRAEMQLLPSAPPIDDDTMAGSSSMPSAPPLSHLYDGYDSSHRRALFDEYGDLRAEEASPIYSRAGPSSTPLPATNHPASRALLVSASSLDYRSHDAVEDKQELERRRLLAEESAPPLDDNDSGNDPVTHDSRSGLHNTNDALPSAPVLDDNDGEGEVAHERLTYPEAAESSSSAAYRERPSNEALPRYQK